MEDEIKIYKLTFSMPEKDSVITLHTFGYNSLTSALKMALDSGCVGAVVTECPSLRPNDTIEFSL